MVQFSFTGKTRELLEAERYSHPQPKVQRKLEALYRKNWNLPHHLICRICHLTKPTLLRELRAYAEGSVAGLKQLGYAGRPSKLEPHRASLAAQFRPQPPQTGAPQALGIELEFLPSYSPNLNLLEP